MRKDPKTTLGTYLRKFELEKIPRGSYWHD
jgi:hypothetical protein